MALTTETRPDGLLAGVTGSTRSGKTAGMIAIAQMAARVLAWDIRGEFHSVRGFRVVRTIPELATALHEAGRGEARIAYFGRVEDFENFCRLAYLWLQLWPALIGIDEVADVTRPGKASGQFGELIRKGLYYGGHIYCLTQRPQGTSTDLWGNASLTRAYYLGRPGDRAYMAEHMGIPQTHLDRLPQPDPDAGVMPQYIQVNAGDSRPRHGTLQF